MSAEPGQAVCTPVTARGLVPDLEPVHRPARTDRDERPGERRRRRDRRSGRGRREVVGGERHARRPTASAPGSEKTTTPPGTAADQPAAVTIDPAPRALAAARASVSVRKRQAAGDEEPGGRGRAPTRVSRRPRRRRRSARRSPGRRRRPALQTRPPAAQSVAGCQVRQADPATTGRQRRTCVGPPRCTGSRRGGCRRSRRGRRRPRRLPTPRRSVPGRRRRPSDASYQQPLAFEVSWAQVDDLAAGGAEAGRGRRCSGTGQHAQAPAPPLAVHCLVRRAVRRRPARSSRRPSRRAGHELPRRAGRSPGGTARSSVCPGQESAAVLHAPSLPQPWSDGQFRSDVHGAPVVVTEQAASRARSRGGASRRIGRRRVPEPPAGTPGEPVRPGISARRQPARDVVFSRAMRTPVLSLVLAAVRRRAASPRRPTPPTSGPSPCRTW